MNSKHEMTPSVLSNSPSYWMQFPQITHTLDKDVQRRLYKIQFMTYFVWPKRDN
uniref:Uncharacterized protein n=1 Tax=Anguilla anguilla TaxID=7936 RepID=A0A0E9WK19_ANGAN